MNHFLVTETRSINSPNLLNSQDIFHRFRIQWGHIIGLKVERLLYHDCIMNDLASFSKKVKVSCQLTSSKQPDIIPNIYCLLQWFSTFGSWRPKKENKTLFSDPYITIILLYHRFWRPKSKCLRSTC